MKLSSSVHPHLVGELLRTLANMGVDTVRQLLARDPHLLAARTGLDLNTVRDIRCTCLAAFPQEAVSLDWDRNAAEKQLKVSSGVPQLGNFGLLKLKRSFV